MTTRRSERALTVALVSEDRGYKAGLAAGRRQAKQFGQDVGQASGGIKQMNSSLDVSVQRMKAFVGIVAGAAIGRQLVQWAGDVKDSAVSLNESINAINVAAGDGADEILRFGENAATSVGLAQSEFNQAIVPIVSQLRNFGFAQEDAADASIVLTERAADLASVFNTDVSEALGAIQAALRGESDPIERFGASISAARVETKLLNEGLVDSKSAITDADKVMGRYLLIMEDTARVQGDFSNTSDELANRTRIFQARLEDWKAEVGQSVIPVYEALLDAGEDVLPVLSDLGENVVPVLADAFIDFVSGVEAIVRFFSDLPDVVQQSTLAIGGLTGAIALAVSHPYVAGFAAVAAGIALIGDKAQEEEARVDDLREAIAQLREEGNKAPLDEVVGSQIAEAVGDADKLLGVLDLIGVSLSQFKGFAIGDPDDVRVVTAAFESYREAQEGAFASGDIGAQTLAGLIGQPSDFAFVEGKLEDVRDRVSDVADEYDRAAEEQAKLTRREDIEAYESLVYRNTALVTDSVQRRVDAAKREQAAAEDVREQYDELQETLTKVAETYAGQLSSSARNYLDIFTEAPEIETTTADQLLTNLETRADQLERYQAGIARLGAEKLFNLQAEFAAQGPESVGTLEAIIDDIDAGGSTAFTLDETIAASETEIDRWATQMGNQFAVATTPLLDQGRTFGEQWAAAVAAGVSDTQLEFLISAQVVSGQGGVNPAALLGSGIEARAYGGPVVAGRPYVVGERGVPELFVPHQSGTVVPSVGGGSTTVIEATYAPVINAAGMSEATLSQQMVRDFDDLLSRYQAGARRPQ